MRFALLYLSFALSFLLVQPARAADLSVTGLWQTEDRDGVIEIYPCGEKICGRFYALKDEDPAHPSLDHRNPDPEKKKQPLCGMTFMNAFQETKPGLWEHGSIYSPRHGGNFSATLRMVDGQTLALHGYMFFPLFGESQTWKRVQKATPCWPTL